MIAAFTGSVFLGFGVAAAGTGLGLRRTGRKGSRELWEARRRPRLSVVSATFGVFVCRGAGRAMHVSGIWWWVRGVVRFARCVHRAWSPAMRQLVFCRSDTSAARPRGLLEGGRTPVRAAAHGSAGQTNRLRLDWAAAARRPRRLSARTRCCIVAHTSGAAALREIRAPIRAA